MKRKQKTVTIGIPAYNEEKTIGRVLKHIHGQKVSNYVIDKIQVISDGSDDRTVQIVKDKYPGVVITDSKKKKGKNYRVNQFLKNNTSDVLILMDADIELASSDVVDRMVSMFQANENLGAAYAHYIARKPDTFVGKLAYFGYQIWDKSRDQLGEKGIRYHAEGGLMAFSKMFASQLRVPSDLAGGDDPYSFYRAIECGMEVDFDKNAGVYIELADNVHDYVRQMRRFLKDPNIVEQYFSDELVKQYETMTLAVKLKTMIKMLFTQPFIGGCYAVLQMYTKLTSPFQFERGGWQPITRK